MTTASRGAWPYFYAARLDRTADPNGRDAYGIYGFKKELIYNGFSAGIDPTLAYWGTSAVRRTRDAQRAFGLLVDGVLGPVTARCLLRHRFAAAEAANGLPAHALAQIATLESDDDIVAQGWVDPNDEGVMQENLPSNPDLTPVECWTPEFIVPHAASQLAKRISSCGSVKAGIAAWNIGNEFATEWRQAGYPASGRVVVVDGQKIDMFTRATGYYADVTGEPL